MAGKRTNEDRRRLIGRRIRRRRLFLGKTQAGLARALGITYQQFQKYETGTNRISESRLGDIARLMGVAPDYFSVGDDSIADALENFVESPEGLMLNRAVAGVAGAARNRLTLAIAALCDSYAKPDEAEVVMLAAWLAKMSKKDGAAECAADAQEMVRAAKMALARLLGKTIRDSRMTQLFAAQILHSDQAKISTIARGDVRGVSLEKLLRFLVLLGWDADIRLVRRPAGRDAKTGITFNEERD